MYDLIPIYVRITIVFANEQMINKQNYARKKWKILHSIKIMSYIAMHVKLE